jgi:hypothetical protein
MHLRPDPTILDIFQWFLAGSEFTIPSSVESVSVPYQGAGSDSCAIAAFNQVETDLDTEIGMWSMSTSPFFRNRALRNLITYHIIASGGDVEDVSPLFYFTIRSPDFFGVRSTSTASWTSPKHHR